MEIRTVVRSFSRGLASVLVVFGAVLFAHQWPLSSGSTAATLEEPEIEPVGITSGAVANVLRGLATHMRRGELLEAMRVLYDGDVHDWHLLARVVAWSTGSLPAYLDGLADPEAAMWFRGERSAKCDVLRRRVDASYPESQAWLFSYAEYGGLVVSVASCSEAGKVLVWVDDNSCGAISARCRTQLRQVYLGLVVVREERGSWPPLGSGAELDRLFVEHNLLAPEMATDYTSCPAQHLEASHGRLVVHYRVRDIGTFPLSSDLKSEPIVVCDFDTPTHILGMNVLFADGHVEFRTYSDLRTRGHGFLTDSLEEATLLRSFR